MLFLLPIEEKISLQRIPWLTLLLVVLCVGVFLSLQLDDRTVRTKAQAFYFDTELANIELPQYIRFARRHMHVEAYFNLLEGVKNGSITKDQLYLAAQSDPIFQNELKMGHLIKDSHPKALTWRKLKREYNYLTHKDHTMAHGFKTAAPNPWSVFTSFFYHGSWHHVLGNVIFLLFIGLQLELAIGSLSFGFALLVCHLVSLSIYSFVYPFSLIPLVGASGGIAGLMGMYAALYGRQKVHYFINILFYLNTVKLPGWFVIPVWLGWELFDYAMHPLSAKAYAAHIGGFTAGILLGLVWAHKTRKATEKTASDVTDIRYFQKKYNDALDKMADLNFPMAKKLLWELHHQYPNNQEVLFQLFNATKSSPSSEDYHKVAGIILGLKDNSKTCVSKVNLVFKNYVKNAEPSIRFDPNSFLSLQQKFRKYGYIEDAEKILKVLVHYNKSGKMDEVLAREQLQLVRAFLNKNDVVKAKSTLEWCRQLYPETASAKEAKSIQLQQQF